MGGEGAPPVGVGVPRASALLAALNKCAPCRRGRSSAAAPWEERFAAGLQVVLVEPEIPPNTGNVGRTCVVTGTRLHLVRPLGFSLEDRYLRRAGCDYWPGLDLVVHDDWGACAAALGGRPLWLFTGRGGRPHVTVPFGPDDALVFGRESTGLPDALLASHPDRRVRLPMRPGWRSLNLGNAVAVGLYEALRQQGFPGMV